MGLSKEFKDLIHAGSEHSYRRVFAHYMVGLTCNQSTGQWFHDMKTASGVGIDGFALNIGPSDPWTENQLHLAYDAAEHVKDFVLFLSFDMAAGQWSIHQVVHLINRFKSSKSQMTEAGSPFVSTFEGPDWADNWDIVRHETGGIFLVPDWSSLGPYGVGEKLDLIDGAFSWDAWPKAGLVKMTTCEDELYKKVLGEKKYMMPISPFFYTNLPQWDKNWYCSSESLWHDRWQQVMEVMPDYVQIITWNDYGESSYICDTAPAQIAEGAQSYIVGHSHSAFRAVLPYFIAAYKAGTRDVDSPGGNTAVAWYRTTPIHAGSDGNTLWGQGGSESAVLGAKDVISIMTVTDGSCPLTVSIGDQNWYFEAGCRSHVSYFEVPFNSWTIGPVSATLNGKVTHGPPISNQCLHGKVNFNCVAIQV